MWKIFPILFLLSPTSAWWCTGHMLAALLAQIDLSSNDPKSFQEASNIVSVLNGVLSHNMSNTFVESACWADDIKVYNVTYLSNGHFFDQPYNPEGLLDTSAPGANILFAWSNAMLTLSTETLESAPLETSFSMRFLIHLAGDIHQPLHCTNMWSSDFPNGDMGGNLFKIQFNEEIDELHAFWDSGAGYLETDLQRPLSQESWDQLLMIAEDIRTQWPRNSLLNELQDKEPSGWCQESYQDAVNYVYDGIVQNEKVTQDYTDRSWQVIRKRLALAGYRLSDTISSLY